MVGEVERSNRFVLLVALGFVANCGGTVETRSTSGNVETDGGGSGGTNGVSGASTGGRRSGNGGLVIGGSPAIAGSGGDLIGSCNLVFCAPEGAALGCCMTVNGPCGVNYGNGCIPRGVMPPPTPPTCTDGVRNGTETDIDCGGPACLPCARGEACLSGADCVSNRCMEWICEVPIVDAGPVPPPVDAAPPAPPTCLDGVKNGTETDVDCGGACVPCAAGKVCNVPGDCMSWKCFPNHTCGTAECTDAVKNGTETDVDCGGSACPKCSTAKGCLVAMDCASRVCAGALCLAPSCTDGVLNGNELCVDCGGSCAPCTNCPAD